MMLLAQSTHYAASSTDIHVLLPTPYSHVSQVPSTNAGFLKTYNPPFSRPEFPISANTRVIPSVVERQIRQYQRDSPSTMSRSLVDGNLTQQSYTSRGNPRTPSTLPSTKGSTNILYLAPPRQESSLISGPANAGPRDLSSPV